MFSGLSICLTTMFHEWKVIPIHLTDRHFGKDFKFYPNIKVQESLVNYFPCFHKEMVDKLSKYLSSAANFASAVSSQYLWYNSNIQIDHKHIYLKEFAEKNINFVSQLFNEIGRTKSGIDFKTYHSLSTACYFN